jgi:hypothetical protein
MLEKNQKRQNTQYKPAFEKEKEECPEAIGDVEINCPEKDQKSKTKYEGFIYAKKDDKISTSRAL